MFCHRHICRALGIVVASALCSSAGASFHVMQIEQVMAGVNGDVTAQAIQLRSRTIGQNLMHFARIRAWDAAGANPVLLVDMTTDVPNGAAGAHCLITTAAFNSHTTPTCVSNFTMDPIPGSYLAAGSLTFEDDSGIIYWRLSWGGAAYTGLCTGATTNDADGNFCPAWPGVAPSFTKLALQFQGTFSAPSTNNAANYALTTAPATFINNAGTSFAVTGPDVGACCLGNGACLDSQQEFDCGKNGGVWQGANTFCGATTCGQPCTNDVNGDGTVNTGDLLAIINSWGPCVGCPTDINGDGAVNTSDLLSVINNWGPCP